MNKKRIIPVTLLTGYLGAGKTTLLNYVLGNQQGYKVAVIVNDIGEVNIDAKLIQDGGVVTSTDNSLVPLQNGCICCTLKQDLLNQLAQLCDSKKYDYILIEASGICEPVPIVNTIEMLAASSKKSHLDYEVKMDNIVSVVDAARLVDEFGKGRGLLKEDLDDDDIENLIIQQIEFCTKIIVNKTDLVTPTDLKEVEAVLKAIQPEAEVIESTRGVVAIDKILGTDCFDFDKASSSAAWIKGIEEMHEEEEEGEEESGEVLEYNIGTFVYMRRRPFDYQKFYEWANNNYPNTIIRCKGICWVSKNPDDMHIFEQAGHQKSLTNAGPWVACYPPAKQKEILRYNPDVAAEWDEVVGDRMNKLVFIGKDMDRKAIEAELDSLIRK